MTSCAQWVDPFIGVDGMGNTLCGPYLPFSLVRLGPDTVRPHKTNGYNSLLPILRFSHTHVSGTGGGGRYGNVGITPFTGVPRLNVDPFEREQEQASAGYYSVILRPAGIHAELTVTPRTGCHRYTFPSGQPANLLIDAGACIQRDLRAAVQTLGGYVEWISDHEVVGRGDIRGGWGHDFPYSVFFYARLDRKPDRRFVANEQGIHPGTSSNGINSRALAVFSDGGVVHLQVGLSFVSVAKARVHVTSEIGTRSFAQVRAEAEDTWEKALSRIRITGGSEDERKIFYTFMYRLLCMPTDLGVDDENPFWHSGVRHFWDLYCLWDSVRNANSLLSLFDPRKEAEILNCLLDVAEHNGWLPDAWIVGHSAMIQGGSSADTLFCEAKLKGLTGIDYEKALRFMRKNNEVESPDPYLYGRYLAPYRDLGFVKNGIINCVSRHLEYTYQDWCIGRLADGLGQPEVAAHYYTSSRKVWNLWKESIRSFAPRNEDGQWVEPFDPTKCRRDSWNDPYFYEGTSLGWSFNVQHDFAGLIRRHGGPEAFVAHLDRYFDSGHSCTKEVFMHIPQLYTYAGRPDCTSARLWNVLHERYSTRRNGIPDNEDMGCHSAFYMCSSMGLYPIMGQDLYLLSTPFFERTEIELGDPGRTLVIEAPQAGGRCRHIQAATLNGVPLNRAWLRHAEIAHGGTLRLELADRPSAWGTTQPPPSPLDGSAP